MDLPAKVTIYTNIFPDLNAKNGELISIAQQNYYELHIRFKEKRHVVLLPISQTILIFEDPLLDVKADFEIER